MIHYEPIKVEIDITDLAKVIIDIVIFHYKILKSIIIDCGFLFILKFWSSLCYFLEIKKKLFIAFYL